MRIPVVALALLLGIPATTPAAIAAQPAIPSDIALPGDSKWATIDLVYTPDGSHMIASSYSYWEGGRITLLDTTTGQVIEDRLTAGGNGLVMSPRGDRVLLTGIDSIMDTASGALIADLPVDAREATFSPDGSRLFLLDADNRIVAFDTATMSPMVTGTPLTDRYLNGLAISPSGDRLVLTSGADGLRSFDPTTLTLLAQGSPMSVLCPTFSPGGDRVFALTQDKFLQVDFNVFDASSLALLSTVPLDLAYWKDITCPLLSPDGSRAYLIPPDAYGSASGSVAVIDTATMAMIGSIKPKVSSEPLLALSPDGSSFWQSGSPGNTLVATPVSRMTSTLPAMPWVGRYDDWKVLPEVVELENRISRLLAGSFFTKGRTHCCEDESPSRWKDIIHTPASTRVHDYKGITYWSATEVCTRRITKRSPATIAQDRRATFTCRPRSTDPSELDPVQELLADTPVRHMEMTASEQQYQFIALYTSATDSWSNLHAPEHKGLAVQDNVSFKSKGRHHAYIHWGAFTEYWVDIFTRNVPKLPSVASLRRA